MRSVDPLRLSLAVLLVLQRPVSADELRPSASQDPTRAVLPQSRTKSDASAAAVSPRGDLTYAVPFDLPAGYGDASPGLALRYSSAGRTDIARGWSLTTPRIVPWTRDGFPGPGMARYYSVELGDLDLVVEMTLQQPDGDCFVLPPRLPPPEPVTVAWCPGPQGPDLGVRHGHFVARRSDGRRYWFRNRTDVHFWITRLADRHDNLVTWTYAVSEEPSRELQVIEWGYVYPIGGPCKTSGWVEPTVCDGLPSYRVALTWGPWPNAIAGAVSVLDGEGPRGRRLQSLDVQVRTYGRLAALRRYDLLIEPSTPVGWPLLRRIQHVGLQGQGAPLHAPPLEFEYLPDSPPFLPAPEATAVLDMTNLESRGFFDHMDPGEPCEGGASCRIWRRWLQSPIDYDGDGRTDRWTSEYRPRATSTPEDLPEEAPSHEIHLATGESLAPTLPLPWTPWPAIKDAPSQGAFHLTPRVRADLDGDGLEDFLGYSTSPLAGWSDAEVSSWSESPFAWVNLRGTTEAAVLGEWTHPEGFRQDFLGSGNDPPPAHGYAIRGATVLDMNGDARPDLVWVDGVSQRGPEDVFRPAMWKVAFNLGVAGGNGSFGAPVDWPAPVSAVGYAKSTSSARCAEEASWRELIELVDLGGDGLPDLIIQPEGCDHSIVFWNRGTGFLAPEQPLYPAPPPGNLDGACWLGSIYQALDIPAAEAPNGLAGERRRVQSCSADRDDSDATDLVTQRLLDLNADGLQDLVSCTVGSCGGGGCACSGWLVRYGMGRRFSDPQLISGLDVTTALGATYHGPQRRLADRDGFVFAAVRSTEHAALRDVDDDGLVDYSWRSQPRDRTGTEGGPDGEPDAATTGSDRLRRYEPAALLSGIRLPGGGRVTASYAPSTKFPAAPPFGPPPFPVVERLAVEDGAGRTAVTTYDYGQPVRYRGAPLGFARVARTLGGVTDESVYLDETDLARLRQRDDAWALALEARQGHPVVERTFDGPPNAPARVHRTIERSWSDGQPYLKLTRQRTTLHGNGGADLVLEERWLHDQAAWGRLLASWSVDLSDRGAPEAVTFHRYEDPSAFRIPQLERVRRTAVVAGTAAPASLDEARELAARMTEPASEPGHRLHEVVYDYEGEGDALYDQRWSSEDGDWIGAYREHDLYGFLVAETDPGYHRTVYERHPDNPAFVRRVLHPSEQHEETTRYFGLDAEALRGPYGSVWIVRSVAGAETETHRDPFGRTVFEQAPEGQRRIAYFDDRIPQRAVEVRALRTNVPVPETAIGRPEDPRFAWRATYRDALGRVLYVREPADAIDVRSPAWSDRAPVCRVMSWRISEQTDPDERGNVAREYPPYVAGLTDSAPDRRRPHLAIAWDGLGRLQALAYPDGTRLTARHRGGLTEQWVDTAQASGQHYRALRHDALGRLRESWQDHARPGEDAALLRRHAYGYSAFGELETLQDPEGGQRLYAYDSLGRRSRACDGAFAASGRCGELEQTYAYDRDGLLLQKTTNGIRTVAYEYDVLHRLVAQSASDGRTLFTYDTREDDGAPGEFAHGRLTRVSGPDHERRYAYDAAGRRISERLTLSGSAGDGDWRTRFTYDSSGQPLSVTYPDGETVHTSYDRAGRPVAVGSATGGVLPWRSCGGPELVPLVRPIASKGRYDARDRLRELTYGNGLRMAFGWDLDEPISSRLESIDLGRTGAAPLATFRYGYHPDGLLESEVRTQRSTRGTAGDWRRELVYSYDQVGRVAERRELATPDRAFVSDELRYDATGNLLRLGGFTQSYSPGGRLTHRDGPAEGDELTLSYAATGEVAQISGYLRDPRDGAPEQVTLDLTWDGEGRLGSVASSDPARQAAYRYDASGQRWLVEEGGRRTIEVNRYFSIHGEVPWKSYWLGDRLVARVAVGVTPLPDRPPLTDPPDVTAASCRPVVIGVDRAHPVEGLAITTDVIRVGGRRVGIAPAGGSGTGFVGTATFRSGSGRSARLVEGRVHLLLSGDSTTVTGDRLRGALCPSTADAASSAGSTPSGEEMLFVHQDRSLDVALLSDPAGNLVTRRTYQTFGEVDRRHTGRRDVEYGFHAQMRDENGFVYWGARYYWPEVGRWLSPDTDVLERPEVRLARPQDLNLYAFAMNNPINNSDWRGRLTFAQAQWQTGTGAKLDLLADLADAVGTAAQLAAVALPFTAPVTAPLAKGADVVSTLASGASAAGSGDIVGVVGAAAKLMPGRRTGATPPTTAAVAPVESRRVTLGSPARRRMTLMTSDPDKVRAPGKLVSGHDAGHPYGFEAHRLKEPVDTGRITQAEAQSLNNSIPLRIEESSANRSRRYEQPGSGPGAYEMDLRASDLFGNLWSHREPPK